MHFKFMATVPIPILEAALSLWKMALSQVSIQPVQHDHGKDLPWYREQVYASFVVTGLVVFCPLDRCIMDVSFNS